MRKIMIGGLLALALAGLTACNNPAQVDRPLLQPQPTVELPAVVAPSGVIAEGRVVPIEHVSLAFEMPGTVAEILVAEGDMVTEGQALARLDTRDLALQVEQAQVSLAQAQADYDKLLEGATPEQVAAAEAEIARAEGSLQATQFGVTQADIAAAQADLASARASLAELQAGPKNTDIRSAQAVVDQSRANLQSQRNALSQAKSSAELQLTQAANVLRNAQDEYSRIYWDNRDKERLPGDLPQELIDAEAAALRAVDDSEAAFQQAELSLEQARQAEITGIESAEAQLRDAEARLESLLSPADADAIAAAQAQVANAQARLAQLTGGEREGNIAAAAAGVASAQANLDEINAKPSDATLAGALARIKGAEVSLKQAELTLEKATLLSPITGTVAELNLKVGEVSTGSADALVIADLSNWQIETEDLTELDVVKVREGDQVIITFDAIDDFELPGTVTTIKPIGENRQGDIVYSVTITPNSWDDRLRWNMTASVRIGA